MATTNRRRDARKLFVWLDQVRGDPELSPSAFKVAYEIGQHFNARHGGAAWPSSLTIATNVGLGKTTVIRVVQQLRERGHLKIDPGKAGRGFSNQYFMVVRKGAAAYPKPAAKTCASAGSQDADKRSTSEPFAEPIKGPFSTPKGPPVDLNYLEPPMGPPSAVPKEERESELALADIPGAPAPVGGALEEGKEVAVDRFPDLWALWSSRRSWPDDDEATARRSFVLECREAQPSDIMAAAQAWVSAVEPRYLPKLSKWLLGRGFLKLPPARRQRHGGNPALAERLLHLRRVQP
jgi:hypothetical protein